MVPLGFNTLVEMVEKVQDWETHPLVEDDAEMWSSFFWAVLLGGSKSEAEVNYVLDILENSGLTERSSLNPHWKDEAVSVLSEARSEITDDDVNPERKKGAIKKIEVELSQIDTTLKSADEIFDRTPRISADYFRSIANNTDAEDRFIADFASSDIAIDTRVHPITTHTRKIPGIAYTKTILWMHRCGIGLKYIPDNNHSVKFLKECGEPMTNPDFYIINHKFRLVCNSIRTDVYPSGLALWIYESTKSLLNGTKKKQYYKPIKMIKIMENNSLSIEDISNMLDDIEAVVDLEEILNMGCNNP